MRSPRLAALAERLLRGGVGPGHAARIIGELEDHLDDLLAELSARGFDEASALAEAHERLGSEDALVASVLARPELTAWASRRPAVAFGLLPLAVFAASFVASIMTLVMAANLAHLHLGDSSAARSMSQWFSFVLQWALPAATAAGFSYWACRRGVSSRWPTVGILIMAIVGALTNFGIVWPQGAARGALNAGIGFSTSKMPYELSRAAATVAIFLLGYFAPRHLRRRGIA